MTDTEWTHEEIDELMMKILRLREQTQDFLEEHRTPPPRAGKYKNQRSTGVIPSSELEAHIGE